MITIVEYLEKQLLKQYLISNPPFEEPFEIIDDDTIISPTSGMTYSDNKYGN